MILTKTVPLLPLVFSLALPVAAFAEDLKPLPSTASYQSQLDMDSIASYGHFALRRAYVEPQRLPSGKNYSSTVTQYAVDCAAGKVVAMLTEYYGEDRGKAFHYNLELKWKLKFGTPEPGSDVAAAMPQACQRLGPGGEKKLEASPAARGSSTGSGIVIDREGVVLTNDHVLRQCDSYQVIREGNQLSQAKLLVADAAKDLALLKVDQPFPDAASLRKNPAPRLGESVVVVGYPLVNVLGTQPHVGVGNVNSLTGIRGNPAQMQIDVAVQRGNSGGPVLDEAGELIGVVVSKLDALKLAKSTGDLAQNVNFAIRGDTVRAFLEANKVKFSSTAETVKLQNTEIAERGAKATVLIRCVRGSPPPAASH